MAKSKPGLPQAYSINLPAEPADLGDYLDEEPQLEAALAIKKKRELAALREKESEVPQTTPLHQQYSYEEKRAPQPQPREEGTLTSTSSRRKPPIDRRARVQINMGAQTEQLFNSLVSHVQRYTTQRDVKSSEVFEALVSAASEAIKHMQFGDVPRRGPWGSPTARAFVTGLERAFSRAIHKHYNELSTLKVVENK